ncbi:uncharacterized protein CC84DRAFT_439433 [Paraphaeosphaeria sporulosa]|uniref:Uncharacterized protein n=1 Tax=Paraphaeosphaeria sporulosa TaxID=1460663 RepID=A0A177CQD2_9PLEO|nr:uncharacterized protein CC84DRAFT_439433 [Paraphaeosphaeria sporulosa]OAG09516.1 hypothetical protein CC84DRAFT_439433 [Paraphaeosphaeria sporulosa]
MLHEGHVFKASSNLCLNECYCIQVVMLRDHSYLRPNECHATPKGLAMEISYSNSPLERNNASECKEHQPQAKVLVGCKANPRTEHVYPSNLVAQTGLKPSTCSVKQFACRGKEEVRRGASLAMAYRYAARLTRRRMVMVWKANATQTGNRSHPKCTNKQ